MASGVATETNSLSGCSKARPSRRVPRSRMTCSNGLLGVFFRLTDRFRVECGSSQSFRVTGDDAYFSAARDAGRALAWGQRLAGGWDHRVDVAHLDPGDTTAQRVRRNKGRCTFDDDISQGALTFLIELDDVVEEPWLTETAKLGIGHLLDSQFDNGSWPQWYPLRGGRPRPARAGTATESSPIK